MAQFKKLAQDTAIYGFSSILGRFLNWCLVPLYSYTLASIADYGNVTNLYAWSALLVVVLTYGMETGFFRFMNQKSDTEMAKKVYGTTLASIGFSSMGFILIMLFFGRSIANTLGFENHQGVVIMLGIIVAVDAFCTIPLAYLRYKNKPYVFAGIRVLSILIQILFNIFFLVGCPSLMKSNPELINWFYNPSWGVEYIFISNAISTGVTLLLLLFYVFGQKLHFSLSVLKTLLNYSLPLALFGIASIVTQTGDKLLFRWLYVGSESEMLTQLGIYGACFKVAMVMMMFTYAFRFAYEPFVFQLVGEKNSKKTYALAMKYYIISALIIFLGLTFSLDILQLVLEKSYRVGMTIIPVVLVTYLLQGIVYNLSVWYKVIDKTMYGAIFSFVGLGVTLGLNILLVPFLSYWGAVFASLACYIVITLLSFIIGQKHYYIDYPLWSIGKYMVLCAILFGLGYFIELPYVWLTVLYRVTLFGVFIVYTIKKDIPLKEIPLVNKFLKK